MSAIPVTILWHPHTERPDATEPVTAIVAVKVREEEHPKHLMLLAGTLYLWDADNKVWRDEETSSVPVEPYWWALESDLLKFKPEAP